MSTVTTNPASTSEMLRNATMPEHRTAETRSFITRLMGGELTTEDYIQYLAQLAYIYEALESRAPREEDPELIKDSRLHRLPAAEVDLEAFGVSDWRSTYPPMPQTAVYVDHLNSLPANSYAKYLAHHYTRYLGDLSGGQAISALIKRHYGATPEQTTFYDFSDLGSLVHYKRDYRTAMDNLDLSDQELDELIEEAKLAFEMNTELFNALG